MTKKIVFLGLILSLGLIFLACQKEASFPPIEVQYPVTKKVDVVNIPAPSGPENTISFIKTKASKTNQSFIFKKAWKVNRKYSSIPINFPLMEQSEFL